MNGSWGRRGPQKIDSHDRDDASAPSGGMTWMGESGGGQPSPESTHTTHSLAAVSVPKVAREYQYRHTDSF
jgi:hypothetical protein